MTGSVESQNKGLQGDKRKKEKDPLLFCDLDLSSKPGACVVKRQLGKASWQVL